MKTVLNLSLQLVANLAIAFEPFSPFQLRGMLESAKCGNGTVWVQLTSCPKEHRSRACLRKNEDRVVEVQVQKLLVYEKSDEAVNYKAEPIRENIPFEQFLET